MAKSNATATKSRPKLAGLRLPQLHERTLPNGLQIIAARRGPIPLATIRLVIRGGSTADPEGKHGLMDFTAKLLRRGTRSMAAEEIDEAVEFVGASLGIGVGEDFMSLRVTAPSEHMEAMLEVLGKLVREPTFPETEVESARNRTLAQLANDLDDPALLADRAMSRAMWGSHPYGHDVVGSTAHVRTFTRDDVVRQHRDAVGPKVSMLIAVGELDPQRLFAAAEKAFGSWTGGPEAPRVAPLMERAALHGKIVIVDKPDQTQTQVRLGALAFKRGHPDHVPSHVVNAALGGGFTSRLVEEVRVNRGLSYGVGSGFDTLMGGGSFQISTFTKTETTREIIDVSLGEVEKLRKKGLTSAELERIKTYLAGLYPLRTETNEAIAGGIGDIRLYDLPAEWIESFREWIHAVTPKQVTEVARRWFLPDGAAFSLVGRADAIAKQVKGLGPVEIWKPSDLE
jgi:zinc protease